MGIFQRYVFHKEALFHKQDAKQTQLFKYNSIQRSWYDATRRYQSWGVYPPHFPTFQLIQKYHKQYGCFQQKILNLTRLQKSLKISKNTPPILEDANLVNCQIIPDLQGSVESNIKIDGKYYKRSNHVNMGKTRLSTKFLETHQSSFIFCLLNTRKQTYLVEAFAGAHRLLPPYLPRKFVGTGDVKSHRLSSIHGEGDGGGGLFICKKFFTPRIAIS